MQPSSSSRLVRLDGLRGIAVLCVLLFHAGYFLIPTVAARLLPGGFLGVDLFFVLSGFLMTNILLSPTQSFGRFYVRRVARIFPALYVFLAAQFTYMWAIGSNPASDLRPYGLIALGMGNWGTAVGVPLNFTLGQTWSLGVEEQLYLLWPLALVLFGRSDPRRIKRLCLAGIAVCMITRVVMLHAGVSEFEMYNQTETRFDDFLVGALVAAVWRGGNRPVRHLRPLSAAAAVFLAVTLATADPFAATSRWLYEGGFTAVAASGGILIYACLHESAGTAVAATRPLRAAGRYSYSVYLWHPFIFFAVWRALPHQTVARVLWAAGLLVSISVVSTLAIEEPLRRLAARVSAPRAPQPEPALAVTSASP